MRWSPAFRRFLPEIRLKAGLQPRLQKALLAPIATLSNPLYPWATVMTH
jgi:hypothetical protein